MEIYRQSTELRVIAYYCWKRGLKPPAICKEINSTLGDGTICVGTCQNYVNKFLNGDFQKNDAPRTGRPSADINEQISSLLADDKHHTC